MRARDYYHKRVSPWPRWLLMAALALVMFVAAWELVDYGLQLYHARSLRAELAELTAASGTGEADGASRSAAEQGTSAATPAPTTPLRQSVSASADPWSNPRQKPEVLITYHGLLEKNQDLVGWLNVRALPQVDLPIVQRDHEYYLRRDFYGRSNMNGTAFMDTACSIWPRSDNLIIYAHNMKSGEMFGGLHKLMKEPFYCLSPLTSFNTIYERGMYVPVAVVLCSIHRGDDFFNFYVPDFKDEAAFNKYISRAKELSDVTPPYDVVYGDPLLTLVTCYDEANTKRLVVILRKVRENEDVEELAVRWK